jgi:hypothetical protein
MENARSRLYIGRPATYQIQVQGRLNENWSSWLDNMAVAVKCSDDGPTVTNLTGTVADQSALHGLLAWIRDLSLPLLLVKWVENQESSPGHSADDAGQRGGIR